MKKTLLSVFLTIIATSGLALAHVDGFRYGITAKATVAEALQLKENTFVTLEGCIKNRIDGDKYLFEDKTGTITVEIDMDKWTRLNVGANDKVEITGKIENENNSKELDVDIIKKVKKVKF